MLATLDSVGLNQITLDLGHVGVYEAVLASANLSEDQERTVFDALQRKSRPDLELALEGVDASIAKTIVALIDLHGDADVLSRARDVLGALVPSALDAINTLQSVADAIGQQRPTLNIYFDLAELRGYHYHTGIVFAAYVPGHGQALANGGRYNNVGAVFGRARPATGFATDLKAMMSLLPNAGSASGAISAPNTADAALQALIQELRAAGEIVVNCLSAAPDPRCDRQLAQVDGKWLLQPL